MDIAIVTTRLVERDAQGNFTAATARRLKDCGCGRVSIYTFAYERMPIEGVDVHFMAGENRHDLGSNIKVALKVRELARELSGYDTILLVGPDLGAIAAIHLAKRYNQKLKLLWVYHGLTPPRFLSGFKEKALARVRMAAYLASMRRSNLVQADSVYVTGELRSAGVAASKLVAMPLGVDLARFSAGDGRGIRAKFGIGDSFLLLYVGRLASLKHVDDLIRAVSRMGGANVKLMIVGSGPERERLEALAKELRVDGLVAFAGRVDDVELPDYYAACDAWATASRHEGFCVPIVEAMAAGKPVIVPDVAAMPETAGEAGLKYRPGDIPELVGTIVVLMSDKDLYRSRSEAARLRSGAFELSRVLDEYVAMVRLPCE
jgi:glycosyltransferase involved in cell wall biosynthesis